MFLPPAKPGISGKKIVIENTWVEIIRYISGKKNNSLNTMPQDFALLCNASTLYGTFIYTLL